MIKTFGLSLIGIFIPIYLYDLGYSLQSIAIFFIFNYGFRIGWDYVTAWLVGWFGPKHIMILSHIFLISMLAMLVAMESTYVPLWLVSLAGAIAYSFFFISYHVEFSKIQTSKVGGSQVGRMVQLGKLASALGPLVGGFIAFQFGFSAVLGASIVIILISAVPLLASKEPVRLRQHTTLRGFPWRRVRRTVLSNGAGGVTQMTNLFFWPLFVALFVFDGNTYVSVGMITSLGLASSFLAAKVFGRLVDSKNAAKLFHAGVFGSALIQIVRSMVRTSPVAYVVNLISEPLSIAYMIPYAKNFYGEASEYEGYRDMFIATIIVAANVARFLSWGLFFVLSVYVSDLAAFQIFFAVAAVCTPFMITNHYRDLKL